MYAFVCVCDVFEAANKFGCGRSELYGIESGKSHNKSTYTMPTECWTVCKYWCSEITIACALFNDDDRILCPMNLPRKTNIT